MSSSIDSDLLTGSSAVMRVVRAEITRAAQFPWPVRIEGPRGTGKNLAAKLYHAATSRTGRFVRCGLNVISAGQGRELAELVGWARGAFTGAYHSQAGAIERAHQGTIFFNEVALASTCVQEILLDLMDERTVQRIGECVPRAVDVRMVFATNASLEKAVCDATFRADLYDRLGIVIIRMPALRTHLEDIPELISTLMVRLANEAHVEPDVLKPAEIDRLLGYSWPGNVRELEDALKYRMIRKRLPDMIPRQTRERRNWRGAVPATLAKWNGNKSKAARELEISRKTLYEHLRATSA